MPRQVLTMRGVGAMLLFTTLFVPLVLVGQTSPTTFFTEGFEDTMLTSRGWYDGDVSS